MSIYISFVNIVDVSLCMIGVESNMYRSYIVYVPSITLSTIRIIVVYLKNLSILSGTLFRSITYLFGSIIKKNLVNFVVL